MPQLFLPTLSQTGSRRLARTIALATALAGCTAWADSTSSASSAASTSAGSASESLGASSNSSSRATGVAQGPYTVQEVAGVVGRPDLLQLRLQGVNRADGQAPSEPVLLRVPRVTAEREQLAVGLTVLAQHRPYGVAFATVDADGRSRPFFLVLEDAWHRELDNRPVGG